MDSRTDDRNMLWELARTMTSRDSYPAAIALRKLARAGYTTLAEVDAVSDWVLLATPGIGVGRLGVVRRLVRPGWQPPSRKAIEVAERFLRAARLALRFWPLETLTSVVKGSPPLLGTDHPVEERLAFTMFSEATRKALRHDEAAAWIMALQQLAREGDRLVHSQSKTRSDDRTRSLALADAGQQPFVTEPTEVAPKRSTANPESHHYAYEPEERRRIVERYRAALQDGEVENKEAWAYNNYRISRKTLWRYEQEFPEAEGES
jgi:hypothetical protein